MNVSDRRRLLGPLNAKLPVSAVGSEDVKISTKANDEIRKMFLKTGLVGNANGSAYLEVDDTIIEVSVFGPRPIKGSFIDRASFSVECKFLPYIPQPNEVTFNGSSTTFNNNGKPGLSNIEQKISSYLETSLLASILLEKYPKSTIDVFVTIISTNSTSQSNTSLLHLCNWIVNCSSLALVDSGIELKDIVTSGQVRLNCKTNELILDPEYDDNTSAAHDDDSLDCVVSFMNMRNDDIVGFWIEGNQNELDEDVTMKLIEGCNTMSKAVRSNINSYLVNLLQ
ncbi:exosome complex component Mtr3p [[Candida] anglica]|uniref:Exosome complex component Mtr3p n=1 Tax=[Candida] anglica TaxID=148631 RepID=A0ABP0E8F2_9ASCO